MTRRSLIVQRLEVLMKYPAIGIAPLSVLIGSISYGMPGIILSIAATHGVAINHLMPIQFLFSFLLFFLFSELTPRGAGTFPYRDKILVVFTGIPVLLITYCFYHAVLRIGVPTSTLLLMQSSWIVPVVSAVYKKQPLSRGEWTRFATILVGVLISTGMLSGQGQFDLTGMLWGLGAALSYSVVILSSSNIANGVRVIDKAKNLTFGAFIASLFLFNSQVKIDPISIDALWAVANALFSSILPIMLFGFGMPRTHSSLTGMLVAIELPAAFIFSHLFLNEHIAAEQIIGCTLIIVAIISQPIADWLNKKRN
ncbi:DMT family transporter [Rosenbergiella collisarenosi]|uniref:EamA family transporter n=1 Tax=Rosenbergiella collisarenosi TaxID=1544695 RepID=UPI001BDB2628|nr:DMT family transporter [Rosenbergiella collisarenosi]MBT0720678.1 DMT family transporter [Rosenbergiella collisarenosi]